MVSDASEFNCVSVFHLDAFVSSKRIERVKFSIRGLWRLLTLTLMLPGIMGGTRSKFSRFALRTAGTREAPPIQFWSLVL